MLCQLREIQTHNPGFSRLNGPSLQPPDKGFPVGNRIVADLRCREELHPALFEFSAVGTSEPAYAVQRLSDGVRPANFLCAFGVVSRDSEGGKLIWYTTRRRLPCLHDVPGIRFLHCLVDFLKGRSVRGGSVDVPQLLLHAVSFHDVTVAARPGVTGDGFRFKLASLRRRGDGWFPCRQWGHPRALPRFLRGVRLKPASGPASFTAVLTAGALAEPGACPGGSGFRPGRNDCGGPRYGNLPVAKHGLPRFRHGAGRALTAICVTTRLRAFRVIHIRSPVGFAVEGTVSRRRRSGSPPRPRFDKLECGGFPVAGNYLRIPVPKHGHRSTAEQDPAIDFPICTPQPAACSPRAATPAPAPQRRLAAMGDRRVSESSPAARLPSPQLNQEGGGIACATGAHPGLHSRTAIAGAPIATSAITQPRSVLLGDADSRPQSAEPVSDFVTTFNRLRNLHSKQYAPKIRSRFRCVIQDLSKSVQHCFMTYHGEDKDSSWYDGRVTKSEKRYVYLQEMARQEEKAGNSERASAIHHALVVIDRRAAKALQSLSENRGTAGHAPARAPRRTAAATAPPWDWCMAHRQLLSIREYYKHAGETDDADRFESAARRMERHVQHRFGELDTKEQGKLLPIHRHERSRLSRPEQQYRIFENTVHRTETEGESLQATRLRRSIDSLHENAARELSSLASEYGPLEDLAARAGPTPLQAPASPGSTGTPATARVIGAPLQPLAPIPRQLPAAHADALPMNVGDRFGLDPEPAPGSVSVPPPAPRRPDSGAAALPTVAEFLAEPPGPSSRVMPSPAPPPPTASPREVPWVQRQDIVERFRFDDALIDAGATLGSSCADILGFDATRKQRVLNDLYRLNGSAREDPTAAAALDDVDWSGIVKLVHILATPPSSP